MRSGLLVLFLGCFAGFSSVLQAQDSLLQVVASPGDGAFSLLRKYGADPSEAYKEFVALNSSRLGENGELYEGTTYLIPLDADTKTSGPSSGDVEALPGEVPSKNSEAANAAKTATYDIFGPDYAEVSEVSRRLEGSVFYLVAGHGGPDPGAMTTYRGKSISEDEYAYDVTLRLGRNLLSHGAKVYIIVRDPDDGIRDERLLEMDKDEVVYPKKPIPLNQKARLEQRVEVVNRLYAEHRGKHQRLIVTHVDSRSQGQNIDVFFYHHKKSKSGKKLTEHIHKTFKKKYARYQPGRKYSGTFEDRSGLFMVKNTHPPTAFIEIGNIRNTRDQKRILDPDNRQALAKWICEGVISDFESR